MGNGGISLRRIPLKSYLCWGWHFHYLVTKKGLAERALFYLAHNVMLFFEYINRWNQAEKDTKEYSGQKSIGLVELVFTEYLSFCM